MMTASNDDDDDDKSLSSVSINTLVLLPNPENASKLDSKFGTSQRF